MCTAQKFIPRVCITDVGDLPALKAASTEDMWPKKGQHHKARTVINSLQLLYHANPCNHVLQVLQTTSLVYIVFPYSGPGILWKENGCFTTST